MDEALRQSAAIVKPVTNKLDWRRRMSDHVAYGLLVYTGLQIFVTMTALKSGHGSVLPYLALVVLIGAIIPGCRLFEKRWEGLSDSEAANPEFADRFKRDRLAVWLCALGLPFALTALFKGIAALF
ncbi:MAG: hypothetical protein ABIT16_05840 [Croceibacterium sp.]